MKLRHLACLACLPALAGAVAAQGAAVAGKLVQEAPTLKCLGVRWLIGGDANGNATVEARYRKVGAEEWRRGLDLCRVETRAIRKPNRPPAGHTMFAGSIFGLEERTEYEVKLSLKDPYETTAPMRGCDFDHDGFGGQWKMFLKWNGKRYPTIDAARRAAPVYRHAVRVDTAALFASGLGPPADARNRFKSRINDLRLREGSKPVDAGVALPNINDGCQGEAPDLGAYVLGQPLPHYGPRPVTRRPR